MIQVDVAGYGFGLQGATNKTVAGLYDSKSTDHMGKNLGLRQEYRWGLYDSCGYQKDGSGICNGTSFGKGFDPFGAMLADTPSAFTTQ